jgi:uncharacterized protein (TIGR02186 family)
MRWALAFLLTVALAGWARAEGLVVSLSSQHVEINSTYTGAQLALFGVVLRDARNATRAESYDVLITIKGPAERVTVRRKEPFGPVWLNREQQKFSDVPSVLSLISTRRIQDIAPPEFVEKFGMRLESHVLQKSVPGSDVFGAALIRLKQKDALFTVLEGGVGLITPDVFRATLDVPAIGPLGVYNVDVALYAGGVRIAQAETFFTVGKAGFELFIAHEARDHGILYGVATAAMALAFGWLASIIFRRD